MKNIICLLLGHKRFRTIYGNIACERCDELDKDFDYHKAWEIRKGKNQGMDKEKILDGFIKIEKNKCLAGSGDEGVYMNQVENYINSQRPLWLDAIKYFMDLQKNKKQN